jgi:beta-galactosidase
VLGDFTATTWGERLRLDDGEAVATFAGADLDGSPAVLRRRDPSGGEGWYVGTLPPQAVLDEVVAQCVRSAGVIGAVARASGVEALLADGIEAVRRGQVLFLLNTSTEERDVELVGAHHDLLTGTDSTGTVQLGPEDALALIERPTDG